MNILLLLPEIILAATALLVVLGDLFLNRKGLLTIISLVGLATSLIFAIILAGREPQAIWQGLLMADRFATFMKLIFLSLAALVILASADYVKRLSHFHGEFHALILLSVLGMMLLGSSSSLITIFVSLELASVPLYALTGLLKDQRGTESALKFVLLSAVNSAVLLYGLALVFGFTGTASLSGVASAVWSLTANEIWSQPGLMFGSILVLAGFGFKIAAVPFHLWAPDVYEGSPTPIALLLSVGSKLAGFAVLIRLLLSISVPVTPPGIIVEFFTPLAISHDWGIALAVLAALSMTIGNLSAIPQSNIKRLLAYSGIAHSGYMLIAVSATSLAFSGLANGDVQIEALLFYMLAFAMAEVAVFTAVTVASQRVGDRIADYAGLGRRAPVLGIALTIGLISLTGIPPAAGFIAKFYVFSQAAESGLWWLVVIAVLNTIISAYYYLRIARLIWQGEPSDGAPITSGVAPKVALFIGAFGVLLLGVLPFWGMKLAEFGAAIFLP
ncbi:MAG: NADH-quinone oxidoreductase subunit N [Dehalococcoidia bacterium]|nr:NADH-quinone oxidoreductase subunit N [Dehalococcoidia bacterium]